MKHKLKVLLGFLIVTIPSFVMAQAPLAVNFDNLVKPGAVSNSVSLLLSMSMVTLVPFLLMSTTCFLRIVIVLSMIRQAIGTQQAPPNMVIVSLAMFLSIFVMTPTFNQVNVTAIQPYQEGRISQKEAIAVGIKPFKQFMLKFAREKDIALFLEFSQVQYSPQNPDSLPIYVLIPAFMISELKTAFQIGFLLFIPFVVIDLVVSNILLSLGMFMLSPAMISLPFKILLFVLTDGWNLIIQGLLLSFKR